MTCSRLLHLFFPVLALFFFMAGVTWAAAPVITQLKNQHLNTQLAVNSISNIVIVTPISGRYDSSADLLKVALEARIGSTVTVHSDSIDPETILITDNVIVLGNSATNIFIKKLYRQWYTLLDLTYPGSGGYIVRSLHDPYGTSHNVIFVGGSDDAGVTAAANALTTTLNTGSDNSVGRLMDISLGTAFANLPVVGIDIGTTIPAPNWNVSSWRDSHRDLSGGNETGYDPTTFFGWNPISIAGVLYYMTGDTSYLDLFKQLALPDPSNIPFALRTSDAFSNSGSSPADPLVKNYHYFSHLVDIIYDLIEDSPDFDDTERLQITNKLIEHQYFYDPENAFGRDNGDRHNYWHLFNIYTGSRYLDKYYPANTISGHSWADRITKVQGHFNAVISNPTWGESDTLEWVSTSTEVLFDFFMMDDPETFISSSTAKTYMDGLEIMYTGAEVDDSSRFLSLNLLHKAADMLGDARYTWLRDQLNYDLQLPRIGQSYVPNSAIPILPPTSLNNNITVFGLPLYEWNASNATLPPGKQILSDEGFQILSYRNGLDMNADFLQLDGYFGRGRNPYHTNTLYKLRMFDGEMLLDGYQNDLDITVNGLVDNFVPQATALKSSYSTANQAYLHTETPGMTESVWSRRILYLKDEATIVIDTVMADTSGEFDITLSWELGTSITSTANNARTVSTSNSTLELANGLDVTASGKLVRQVLSKQFVAGEVTQIGNILSSKANPWSMEQVLNNDNAFLVKSSSKQGLLVLGSITTPEFSVTADFAWFDGQDAILANASSFIINGQEQITTPQDILVLSADMVVAISNITPAPTPTIPTPPTQKLNWLIDQEVQLLAGITDIELSESMPDGTLWVAGIGMTDYEIIQLTQNDLSIQGSILHSASKPLSFWLAKNVTQASAFTLLAGFKNDTLFAYDSAHNPLWNVTAQIDPSFIVSTDENGNPVYVAPWFTDPTEGSGKTTGIYSILVDDVWGSGEEIVLGRPSTLEFRDLSGTSQPRIRLPVEWGIISSLSLLHISEEPLENIVLAGKSHTGNPQITTTVSPSSLLSNHEFHSLSSDYTLMHAWRQRGMNHLTVADLENDGIEEIIYTLSGHWNELRVYDAKRNFKWARYFGPAAPNSDYMRALQATDLDNDGNIEIIVGTASGWIYVFDTQGNQLWEKRYTSAVTEIEIIKIGVTRQIVAGFEDGLIITLDDAGNSLLTGQLPSAIDAIAIAGSDVFCGTRTGLLVRMDGMASPSAHVPPVNRPREVGRWRLDESGGLSATNEINPFEAGTLKDDPVWMPGEGNGGAIDFSTDKSRIEVPHSQTFDFDKQVSVATWIKLSQFPDSGNFEIFLTKNIYNGGAWNGFYINVRDDGKLRLVSNAAQPPHLSYLYTADPIAIDEWVHVVMTIDETEARFYINGILSNAVPTATEYNITNTSSLLLGSYLNGQNSYTGLMDDVRIFNYSLSEQEVTDIYAIASHWPLDELTGINVSNVVSPMDNGTLANNPAWSPGSGINGALDFDTGVSHSHVSVADSSTFNFIDQLSASAWIYLDAYPVANFGVFLSKTNYAGGNWHGFYLDIEVDGKLRLVSNAVDNNTLRSNSPVPLGQWVHVAVSIEKPPSKTTLYINGVAVTSKDTNPTLIIDNTNNLTIGAYQLASSDFSGLIDEVRIYDKSLTEFQMNRLYDLELSKNTDNDNDGLSNYQEQCFDWNCNDYNPYHPVSNPAGTDLDYDSDDTDFDGYTDDLELQGGSDPLDNLDAPQIIATGDINMDGVINVVDILLATQHILGLTTLGSANIAYGDLYPAVGGDNQITLSDLILIQRDVLQ